MERTSDEESIIVKDHSSADILRTGIICSGKQEKPMPVDLLM